MTGSRKIGSFKEYCYEQRMMKLNEEKLTITCDWWDQAIVEVMQDLEKETYGLYNWDSLVKYVKVKDSILGRTTPVLPEVAVSQHIKELIFNHHGDSLFQNDNTWMDWDNATLHSKGVVIEELASVILDKVREKTGQKAENTGHTAKLVDGEPEVLVPMTPLELAVAEEDIEDLSCENNHSIKKFDGFIREKKNRSRRPRNEKVK